MREKRFTILVAVLVGVLLVLYLIVYQVRIDQVVVQYRFGRVQRVVNTDGDEAGWYLKFPYPIDTLSRFDRRVMVVDGKLSETTTSDKQNVVTHVYFTWRLKEARGFVSSLGRDADVAVTEVTKRLKDVANTAVSQTLGRYPLSALVSAEDVEFEAIEQEAERYLQEQAAALYHVEVVDFGIKWVALSQDVTAQVFNTMIEERQRVSRGYRSRGDKEATIIVSQAQRDRDKILAEARADAKKTIAEGEVEAAKYLSVFAEDPELHEFLIKLDAMLQIATESAGNENKPVFILDTKSEPWTILETGPNGPTPTPTDRRVPSATEPSVSAGSGGEER